MEKNSKNVSKVRLSSIKDVEKTEITSASFTHVSSKEPQYANMYEADERITTYQAYTEAIAKFD